MRTLWPFGRQGSQDRAAVGVPPLGQPTPYVPSVELPCCPLMGGPCLKEKCALHVALTYDMVDETTKQPVKKYVGKCALAWLPTLSVELRATVDTLRPHGPATP